jgi:hypothetical protein
MKTRADWLESYAEQEHQDMESFALLMEALKRVKEQPETLEQEMTSTAELKEFVWNNWATPEYTIPRRFSAEIDQFYAQPGCALHTIDSHIMLNIAKHLEMGDITSMRRSCKFLGHLSHHPGIFKQFHERYDWNPIPDTWWGEPTQPWAWVSSYRTMRLFQDFLALVRRSFQGRIPGRDHRALLEEELLNFHLKQHLVSSVEASRSTRIGWTTFSSIIVNQSPFKNDAQFLTSSGVFWDVLTHCFMDTTATKYMDQVPDMIASYISAMLRGRTPTRIALAHQFYTLLCGPLHDEASSALAVHHGYKRLIEMDFQIISASKVAVRESSPSGIASRFDLNGIWQGVMHYVTPSLDDDYSEEMIMKLHFPDTTPEDGSNTEDGDLPDSSLPFTLIGMGFDSIGEFELEDATIDRTEFKVTFTKVYAHPAEDGGVLKHQYTGRIYSFGMGGHFGMLASEMGVAQIGYWFMGRPTAYSGGSLAAGDTLDESKIAPWDDLVAEVKAKAATNELIRKKKIAEIGIDDPFFVENPNLQTYELPLLTATDLAISYLRHARRYRAWARTEATTLDNLREGIENLQQYSESEGVQGLNAFSESGLVPFETDTETKAALRKELLTISNAVYAQYVGRIMTANLHLLYGFVATLERYDCDPRQDEVSAVVSSLSRLLCKAPSSITLKLRNLLGYFKIIIEDSKNPPREELSDAFEEELRRDNDEVVPRSVSRFIKRTQEDRDSSDDSDSDSDSYSESDSESDSAEENVRFHRKGQQRAWLSTSSMVVAGSIAFTSILISAFALGRLLRRAD